MNRVAVADLIAFGEGCTTEFKRSGPLGIGREMCTCANVTGGMILLGAPALGEVVGMAEAAGRLPVRMAEIR